MIQKIIEMILACKIVKTPDEKYDFEGNKSKMNLICRNPGNISLKISNINYR